MPQLCIIVSLENNCRKVRGNAARYGHTKATSWAELFERVAATLFVIAFITAPANAEPTILTGIATHVRDGDTIEVGKIPIPLNGVSAPAKKALQEISKSWL
jgi:endonuclease YncB( thermonuclease family)